MLSFNYSLSRGALTSNPKSSKAGANNNSLTLSFEGSIEADLLAVEQILTNLVSNSIKMTPVGGKSQRINRRSY